MNKTLNEVIDYYKNNKKFNAEKWIEYKANKFNEYLIKNNITSTIVSISGGIDSATILGILKYVFDLPNSNLKNICAVNQPIHSSDWALNRSKELCDILNIKLIIIDQTDIHDLILKKLKDSGFEGNVFSNGQLKSYLRTPINYNLAHILSSNGLNSIVIGTGNKDEDGYLGYFCKYGDGAVDVQLISDLHKSEVYEVAKKLKIPKSILVAPPSADLWDGQEDEKEIGVSYDFVEFYTNYCIQQNKENEVLNMLTKESIEKYIEYKNICDNIHIRNKHKLLGIINL